MNKFIYLCLCLCMVAFQGITAQNTEQNTRQNTATVHESENTYSTLVYGICGMCKSRIEKAANTVEGVKSADWDIATRILTLEIDSIFDESQLHKAVNAVGHDTELSKAGQKAYNALDDCCKYRDPEVMADHGRDEGIYSIGVSGNCDMCKARIEEAAETMQAVNNATFDIEKQRLYVSADSNFNIVNLHEVISAAGHDTDQLIADEEAYENLPQCCQYRDPDAHHSHLEDRGNTVSGTVYQMISGERMPLDRAEVRLLGSDDFVFTDADGNFEIELPTESAQLIISFLSYTPDTIPVSRGSEIEAHLSSYANLQEVVISYRKKTSGVSSLETIKTFRVDDSELLKAACCNLSESFETLPAVDVATTDAVTGTRQIKMLGLAGPNISYSQENLPILRGLSAVQGLSLIPGPWISGMQINQSVGSVSNGYESVSGQINVQLRNPETMDPLYVNVYGNEEGRIEGNVHFGHMFNKKVGTAVLLHGNMRMREIDRNKDGFMDATTGDGFAVLNRWKYNSFKNIVIHGGLKYAEKNTIAGQVSELDRPNLWRAHTDVNDFNAWAKIGYVFTDNKFQSIAVKMNYGNYSQINDFGNRLYSGKQDRFHGQLLYQNIIGSEDHEIRGGVGINYRHSLESLGAMNYDIEEIVPHIYAEYTYTYEDIFSAVLGARYDQHNIYGGFFTPRLHLKYNLDNGITFRLAVGQARRTASVLSENISFLASARDIVIKTPENNSSMAYGLPQIKSDNFSFSTVYRWDFLGNESTLSLDYFYTQFDQNVIVDYDKNIHQVNIYSQKEDSRSHNVQLQWDFRPLERFDVRLAYKWQVLKLGYASGLREAPFTPNHRGFLNLAYSTRDKWKFDMTFNLTGSQRIPDTYMLPEDMQMPERSPAFLRINAQISKEIFDGFVLYAGAENLTGYQQEYAIIGADNPFSDTFDASLIWGPIMGRNLYMGIRYTILEKKDPMAGMQM